MGSFAQDIDVDARPATAWSEDALRIFREIQEPAGICWTLRLLAQERFKAGDIDGAASRAIEALDLATRSGMLHAVAQSRGVLAGVAASRGEHADADRLLEEVAAAFEQMGDRWQLALTLKLMAEFAFARGDHGRALGPLRETLLIVRDSGSGDRMRFTVELAAHVLHHRGRAREAATLVGALEALHLRFPRLAEQKPMPPGLAGVFRRHTRMVSAEFEEHRIAGRSLSLERAADLALRVLDEELALAAAAGAGGNEAAGERPSTSSRGGRS